MPRSRPASNPLSFHKGTGQHYVTRAGRRVYLGADSRVALEKYHRLALGLRQPTEARADPSLTAKQLANHFIATQQANWRQPAATKRCYQNWLGRFLEDHPGLLGAEFTVEAFAAWKVSLRQRAYSRESINHYLAAVRALFRFGEETGLIERDPRLGRVRNEPKSAIDVDDKQLYGPAELQRLLLKADPQVKCMIFLALNCGFGPKDMEDLRWGHVRGDRIALPRSKTGVSQTYALWPETTKALADLARQRQELIQRLARRGRERSDAGHVFVTKYWRPWNKDAVAEQFRKLCKQANVPCHGFYRLRHCASTAMALVTMPHVQRRFMRHKQLQQQVTYTHTPDAEVDAAVMRARERLLGSATSDVESGPAPVEAAAPAEGAPAGSAGPAKWRDPWTNLGVARGGGNRSAAGCGGPQGTPRNARALAPLRSMRQRQWPAEAGADGSGEKLGNEPTRTSNFPGSRCRAGFPPRPVRDSWIDMVAGRPCTGQSPHDGRGRVNGPLIRRSTFR